MRKVVTPFLLFGTLSLLIFLSGCAHVISRDLRAEADPFLTFKEVQRNPNAYKGKIILWGGEIIQTVNQKDETTLIEVFQRPLGWRGEPGDRGVSEGRFLLLAEKYLDPYLYRGGIGVTVAGEIQGEMIKPLGEMDYHYPLIKSKEIYFWPEYGYGYPTPYYYYYNPWWGYPYRRY